jgi:hypothetical protein
VNIFYVKTKSFVCVSCIYKFIHSVFYVIYCITKNIKKKCVCHFFIHIITNSYRVGLYSQTMVLTWTCCRVTVNVNEPKISIDDAAGIIKQYFISEKCMALPGPCCNIMSRRCPWSCSSVNNYLCTTVRVIASTSCYLLTRLVNQFYAGLVKKSNFLPFMHLLCTMAIS